MYVDQALREPDRKEFIKAMEAEVKAHTDNGHWKIVPISSVPVGTKTLPAVWAMKRKRQIATMVSIIGTLTPPHYPGHPSVLFCP